MLNISPTIARLVAVGLAIAAIVTTSFVADQSVREMLFAVAGGLLGKEILPRTGDVAIRGVNADDLPDSRS